MDFGTYASSGEDSDGEHKGASRNDSLKKSKKKKSKKKKKKSKKRKKEDTDPTMAGRNTLFLDCDDTLYANDWKTAKKLTDKIEDFCVSKLGLEKGKAYKLYKQYGTCLKGLQAEKIIKMDQTDEFLDGVHDIDLSDISEDEKLRDIIKSIDTNKVDVWVFTASVSAHAERCMKRLNVHDLLVTPGKPVIDVKAVGHVTKHSPEAFKGGNRCHARIMAIRTNAAMQIAKQDDPSKCWLVDDSWSNIRTAKKMGWGTVVCGQTSRDGKSAKDLLKEADHVISTVHELPKTLSQFF